MNINARRKVENYNWLKIAERCSELYRSLI
jgi:hypothetical protein